MKHSNWQDIRWFLTNQSALFQSRVVTLLLCNLERYMHLTIIKYYILWNVFKAKTIGTVIVY